MKPLLAYKEFPLCHSTGKTERKRHYPSGSALFIWMLGIKLESWSVAFIQSKLVVKSMTLKGVRRVKAVFLLHVYI